MFEPRSRGLSTPLPGQPFYGWWDFPLRSVGHGMPCPKGRRSSAGGHRPRRPSGGWGGEEIGRANGRCPSSYSLATNATLSLGGVFLALGRDFGTQNPASRTLFSTPAKPGDRLCRFFSSPSQRLRSATPPNLQSVPYSGTGRRNRNLGGMTLVLLPLSATGSCLGRMKCCYASQFRPLNRQAENSHRRPTRLSNHRQVTKITR